MYCLDDLLVINISTLELLTSTEGRLTYKGDRSVQMFCILQAHSDSLGAFSTPKEKINWRKGESSRNMVMALYIDHRQGCLARTVMMTIRYSSGWAHPLCLEHAGPGKVNEGRGGPHSPNLLQPSLLDGSEIALDAL